MLFLSVVGTLSYGTVGTVLVLPAESSTMLRLIGGMLLVTSALFFLSAFYYFASAGGDSGAASAMLDSRVVFFVIADILAVSAMVKLLRESKGRRKQ